LFRYKNHNVINEKGKVIEVSGNKDNEGQNIEVNGRNNALNQQWDVIYVDEGIDGFLPTSGLDPNTGYYINRPFYFVSRLPMRRVAECIGANNMVIKRYAKGRTG
jgi:hypothetical protein